MGLVASTTVPLRKPCPAERSGGAFGRRPSEHARQGATRSEDCPHRQTADGGSQRRRSRARFQPCAIPHAPERTVHRYYDPQTGEFLSVDPDVSETQQPYYYAGDDPVNNSDRYGECSSGASAEPFSATLIEEGAGPNYECAQEEGVNWVFNNTLGPVLAGWYGLYSVTGGAADVASDIYAGSVAALQAIWSADPANQCAVDGPSFKCVTSFSDWVSNDDLGGPSGEPAGVYIADDNAWQIDWVSAVNGDEWNRILVDSALTTLLNYGTGSSVSAVTPSPYDKAINNIIAKAFGIVLTPTFTPASDTLSLPCSSSTSPPSSDDGGNTIVT